jgi:hypothetical protein
VYVVLGDFLKVKEQLLARGGRITPSLYKRWKRMQHIANTYSTYSGSSSDVFNKLNKT